MVKQPRQPDIYRILELQKLLLKFSQIERVVHRKHGKDFRLESDTEHSFNLAITAWFLAHYFPEIDEDTVIKLAMVHDLVEIYAGDTYLFGPPKELATKHEREQKALHRLKREWRDFRDLTAVIELYEERQTPEARFVYALDKIMPALQIYINEGITWQKEGITLTLLHEHKVSKVALSPEIKPYYDQLYELLVSSPDLIKP